VNRYGLFTSLTLLGSPKTSLESFAAELDDIIIGSIFRTDLANLQEMGHHEVLLHPSVAEGIAVL